MPLQQTPVEPQSASTAHDPAAALFASPKQASAMPASPTPNFFSAARRVTDWARLLVSSSNLLFIVFLSFWLVVVDWFAGVPEKVSKEPYQCRRKRSAESP